MRYPLPLLLLWFIAVSPLLADDGANQSDRLWYAQPAAKWTEALPVGNGRMGAMVFGGVTDEHIQFNEATLWTGHPHDYVRAGAKDHLADIRRLLFAGTPGPAADLARQTFLSDPVRQKAYQPFGDLRLHFAGLTNVTDYCRDLNLDTAVSEVSYRVGGIVYRREVFASVPDQVIVLHISANKPGLVGFTVNLDSPHADSHTTMVGPDTMGLAGSVEAGGLRFAAHLRVLPTGGHLTVTQGAIMVEKADAVTLLLSAATSFKNFQDISGNPDALAAAALDRASTHTYDQLLAAHRADYQRLFGRVKLDLGHTSVADEATDKRLQSIKKAGLISDPALAALEFQYGRYLLISSSRPGGQPANLQGVWNAELNPPWESKWTLNINCEMNYWPAEVGNLSECAQPLFSLIDDLAVSGARTAQEQYGCRGWVVHHNTDLWRGTAPINNTDGIWPTGGAWLGYHLWEHYLFTGDTQFLARAYPDIKGAALFFADDLIKDPQTGWLVTSPSFSPEEGTLCNGPTMDNQLIRALLDSTIAAAGILHTDQTLAVELSRVRQQLPPNQIGRHGQLQEWLTDVDVPNNNHRHLSPLWALYPGADLSPTQPPLWSAAKLLLKWRGPGSTGWSYAWRIPLWARVGDGEYAFQQLSGLLQKRTLPNLFDLCGPFQIDGNFGATAGVAEMLLQSQWTMAQGDRTVRQVSLLPALPTAWPNGEVRGLRARDGLTVDITWHHGGLTHVLVHADLARAFRLQSGSHATSLDTKPGKSYAFDGELHPLVIN